MRKDYRSLIDQHIRYAIEYADLKLENMPEMDTASVDAWVKVWNDFYHSEMNKRTAAAGLRVL